MTANEQGIIISLDGDCDRARAFSRVDMGNPGLIEAEDIAMAISRI